MWPRPPPPPLEPRPTLPLPYSSYSRQEPLRDAIQRLLALAETGDSSALLYVGSSLVLAAIDPITGDSVLHRAAAVGNVDFLRGIRGTFGKQFFHSPGVHRLLWVLFVHRNLVGDTALHAAARTVNLRGVKSIYRLFHGDELDVDNERRGLSTDSGNTPAENWDWDDSGANIPSLVFVCTKNNAGLDAAAEARAAGHQDLAAWFDVLAQRLDHAGMRADKDYMQTARRTALDIHWYYDERDGEGVV